MVVYLTFSIYNIAYLQLVIESVRGSSYKGDIAIDDVSLLDGACPLPGSCDFEDDLCTWTNLRGSVDDFDWTRQNGDTASFNTGPKADHTEGTPKGLSCSLSTHCITY